MRTTITARLRAWPAVWTAALALAALGVSAADGAAYDGPAFDTGLYQPGADTPGFDAGLDLSGGSGDDAAEYKEQTDTAVDRAELKLRSDDCNRLLSTIGISARTVLDKLIARTSPPGIVDK